MGDATGEARAFRQRDHDGRQARELTSAGNELGELAEHGGVAGGRGGGNVGDARDDGGSDGETEAGEDEGGGAQALVELDGVEGGNRSRGHRGPVGGAAHTRAERMRDHVSASRAPAESAVCPAFCNIGGVISEPSAGRVSGSPKIPSAPT